MKKELLSVFILISAIGFASSQGLSDILNQIDQATVILFGIFLVSFALLFFALNKALKGNSAISGVISAVVSFLIVYGVNKSGFDLNGFFYGIGISQNLLATIIPIVIIGIAVILIIKLKKESLLVLGAGLIVLSFFVYAQVLLIIIGVILIVLRFTVLAKKGLWEMKPRRRGSYGGRSYYDMGGGI